VEETRNQGTQEIEGFMHHELQTNTRSISIQKPRGHKVGRASFPTKIQYKVFTNPWLKSYLEERKEEEHRERGGDEGGWLFFFCSFQRTVPGEGSAPFVLDPGATHSLLPPFLAFQDFF